jgi:hypothetical protein
MERNKDLKQAWKSISSEYRNEQIQIDRQSRAPSRFQVPEGQLVLKGGTGTAPLDAVSWKTVLYDTKDSKDEKI